MLFVTIVQPIFGNNFKDDSLAFISLEAGYYNKSGKVAVQYEYMDYPDTSNIFIIPSTTTSVFYNEHNTDIVTIQTSAFAIDGSLNFYFKAPFVKNNFILFAPYIRGYICNYYIIENDKKSNGYTIDENIEGEDFTYGLNLGFSQFIEKNLYNFLYVRLNITCSLNYHYFFRYKDKLKVVMWDDALNYKYRQLDISRTAVYSPTIDVSVSVGI